VTVELTRSRRDLLPGGGVHHLVRVAREPGADVTQEGVRSALSDSVPTLLIPPALVVLDRMPMTTNAKADNTALPDHPSSRPELSRSYTASDSAADRGVARVWQRVLTLDRVGGHDKFFDLGGNSIRLPAVPAALHKHPENQASITLTDLFRHPTVAAVAAHLDQTAEQQAARRGSDRRAALHKLRSRKGTTR
jgi:hypothetical protein